MYLARVSVRRVEDITLALWGERVSPGTVSYLPQHGLDRSRAAAGLGRGHLPWNCPSSVRYDRPSMAQPHPAYPTASLLAQADRRLLGNIAQSQCDQSRCFPAEALSRPPA